LDVQLLTLTFFDHFGSQIRRHAAPMQNLASVGPSDERTVKRHQRYRRKANAPRHPVGRDVGPAADNNNSSPLLPCAPNGRDVLRRH
jgi:hypothetical protein